MDGNTSNEIPKTPEAPKPKKPKAKKPAAKKAAKPKSKPKAKPKAKKKAPAKPKAKKVKLPKAKKVAVPAVSARLDLRITKTQKAKLVAKAAKMRRTVTSLVLEALEKIK